MKLSILQTAGRQTGVKSPYHSLTSARRPSTDKSHPNILSPIHSVVKITFACSALMKSRLWHAIWRALNWP
jgi:hypothetical protein